MPWIRQVPIAEATGELKKLFDAALARALGLPAEQAPLYLLPVGEPLR